MKKLSGQTTSDILVVGYPNGFYDKHSKFPIIKSGIVASKWRSKFNNKPYFLIDAKLFPGSSGSLVITKPLEYIFDGKRIYTPSSIDREFLCLGVYSGQYSPKNQGDIDISQEENYNMGIVWYYYLIQEVITQGISYQDYSV